MEHLEEFYNTEFKMPDDPDFSDLTNQQKEVIGRCLQFSFFQLHKAIEEIGKAIYDLIPRWIKKLMKGSN
ncbi:MAG: hypothetical protein ACWA44_02665 [Thiotrichales bacterium]